MDATGVRQLEQEGHRVLPNEHGVPSRRGSYELLADIKFGAEGNHSECDQKGWSSLEDGFTWTIGYQSRIQLNAVRSRSRFFGLILDVTPFCHPPNVPSQRLRVFVNGRFVGRALMRRAAALGFCIPSEYFSQGTGAVSLTFEHPDAFEPRNLGLPDERCLGFQFRNVRLVGLASNFGLLPRPNLPPFEVPQITPDESYKKPSSVQPGLKDAILRRIGLTPSELVANFENFGDNCEFGLVQRACGVEALGLYRFSSSSTSGIIDGLVREYEGLGQQGTLLPYVAPDGEYIISESVYGLRYHTYTFESQMPVARLQKIHSTALRRLSRCLLDDLAVARKLLVRKSNEPVSLSEMLPLYWEVRRLGNNTLLWVMQEDDGHPAGHVEILDNGLMCGYVDRLANMVNPSEPSIASWLEVCTNALALHLQLGHSTPDVTETAE